MPCSVSPSRPTSTICVRSFKPERPRYGADPDLIFTESCVRKPSGRVLAVVEDLAIEQQIPLIDYYAEFGANLVTRGTAH